MAEICQGMRLSRLGPARIRPMGEGTASRVRAARGYAGVKQKDLAKALSMSTETLHRVESGTRDLTPGEREALIAKCGVPEWFMEHGFRPPWVADIVVADSDERVVALIDLKVQQAEERVRQDVAEQLELIQREQLRLIPPEREERAPAPRGELRRVLDSEPPSREDHPRSGSDQDKADSPGGGSS